MKQLRTTVVLVIGLCMLSWIGAQARSLKGSTPNSAAIASAHPAATAAGRSILMAGGNAFDAAIAVAAALAVVEPYSSGIGGGGFFLLHRASDRKETMLDAREKAPAASTHDMYLDDGEFIRDRALNGPLAAGIPGLAAGLVHLADNYGRLPLSHSLAPAIELASKGFVIGPRYARMAGFRKSAFDKFPASAKIFLGHDGSADVGDTIVQADLANTLRKLAEFGAAGFYAGELAEQMVQGVREAGGIWTLQDLTDYTVVEREPIVINYHDVRIVSAPPPSSGGVALAEIFHILSEFNLEEMDENTKRHVVIEAMRRAYRDRAEYLGDPDFVDVPVARLVSVDYGKGLAADLSIEKATPSSDLRSLEPPKGRDTTHYSVLDAQGNRVAATLSVNYPFGAAFVPPNTGVLLNNEMDDFSARPFTPNVYGLVGVTANAIAPGKRPLSSMTPTFLETADKVGILGTPGGSRIITMVLVGILEFLDGKKPDAWVSAKRYHHQYLPDEVQFELGGLSDEAQRDLERRGHKLKEQSRNYGNMHAILWDRETGAVDAASDPRGEGAAEVFAVGPTEQTPEP
ncbi:MAG: gamma-glutamyltranspeptidase/glutathione hydrolase [Gammaproteobacteria bacterium]|jgi:gamma-glutamyltranspeptidase/glutathione hydrolase